MREKKICTIDGCSSFSCARRLCNRHYKLWRRYGEIDASIQIAPKGAGSINKDGYRVIHVDGRPTMEHRHVMSQHLKRELKSYETVHHKDGNRSNNDIANLELWSSRHPKGQRIEDLLEWAYEIIDEYG